MLFVTDLCQHKTRRSKLSKLHWVDVLLKIIFSLNLNQIGNTLRLSFQSESSVSGTELRLPSACVLPFIMHICQKRATIMHICNNNVYS